MIKLRKLITSIQNNLIRLSKRPKKVSVDITWWVWRSMADSWQDGNFWKCACSFLSVMINHHVIHTAYCRSPLKNVPISVSLVLLIQLLIWNEKIPTVDIWTDLLTGTSWKTRWSQQIQSLHSHLQWAEYYYTIRGCLPHIGSQNKNVF